MKRTATQAAAESANSKSAAGKPKTDLRVLKTQLAIRGAFTDLLEEKPFSSITVQNIIDRARVNRKTFYNHYHDKYDLAEQVMTAIGTDLRSAAGKARKMETLERLRSIHASLQAYRSEVLALWDVKTNRNESMSGILTEILAEMYHDEMHGIIANGMGSGQTEMASQAARLGTEGATSNRDAAKLEQSADELGGAAKLAERDAQLQANLYATLATAALKFILESSGDSSIYDLQQAMKAVTRTLVAILDNDEQPRATL